MSMKHRWNDTEVLGASTFPTTNATRTGLWLNPGLRDKRPATNRLIHNKARDFFLFWFIVLHPRRLDCPVQ